MRRSDFVTPPFDTLLFTVDGEDLFYSPPGNLEVSFQVPMDAASLFNKVVEEHVRHAHSLTSVLHLSPRGLTSLY